MPNPTCLFSLVHAPVLLLRLGFLEVTHDRKQTRRSTVVARGEASGWARTNDAATCMSGRVCMTDTQRGEQLAAHREREVGRAQRTRRQAPAAGHIRQTRRSRAAPHTPQQQCPITPIAPPVKTYIVDNDKMACSSANFN
jgi:hypothetical protein